MDNYLSGLNENQYKAVVSQSQIIRLVAGAGSGKTRVLTTRIAYLIDQCHVNPHKILAITFTNKAANEMKNRVGLILNNQQHGVWLSTIHALCVRILREECIAIGYPKNFTIADVDEQKQILKEAYRLYNIDLKIFSYNSVLGYIANQKYAQITPQAALVKAGPLIGEKTKALCYQYYQDRLKSNYAFDFDDLIIQTIEIFKKNPVIQGKWQDRFDYIMVDEFQDVDRFEYDLVKRLVGNDNYLCVVGDPDQTIYTWRGADVNIILKFDKDYPNSETIFLNENYRSTPIILKAANSLIANNKNRLKKDLYTKQTSQDKIIHTSCADEDSESRWVISEIQRLHNQGCLYKDMAILYRSNYISRQFEKQLFDQQIPYVIWGGMKFYDRAEIKDAIAYLRMVDNGDDLAFKRIINNPRRGIGDKTLDTLLQKAQENHCSMFEAINLEPYPSARAQATLVNFYQLVQSWRDKKNDLSMIELMELILDQSGYRAALEEERETDRLENLKELLNDMQHFILEHPDDTIDQYLQLVATYGDKDDQDGNADTLRLMTVHAAKGLEFDNVFVVGMSDGVFPNERAMNDTGERGLEEERRLAYVAFTRAKKHLYITDCQGFSYQLKSEKVTSRFVNEMDKDLIENKNLAPQFIATKTMQKNTPSRAYEKAVLDDDSFAMPSGMKTKNDYKPGQKVTHDQFGDGIVVKVEGNFVSAAFAYPHGVKKILYSAKALHHRLKS